MYHTEKESFHNDINNILPILLDNTRIASIIIELCSL